MRLGDRHSSDAHHDLRLSALLGKIVVNGSERQSRNPAKTPISIFSRLPLASALTTTTHVQVLLISNC